ncbi:sensor histidine kinase [Mariniluteicoccus flavus]
MFAPRLDLRHALHVSIAVLLGLGVLRGWQQQSLVADGRERALLATLLATAFFGLYVVGVVRERRTPALAGRPASWLWITLLVAIWVIGAVLSEGFLWVAFPLFFLVLFLIPGWWGVAAVGSMVLWSVAAAMIRSRLDRVGEAGAAHDLALGTWLGPLLGALCAILAYAVFLQLRRDADRHRALVAELRAAQAELAATERTSGMRAERERLAREIHDTIAQGLGSIVMMARTARVERPDDPALTLIESTARENLTEARRFVRDLGSGAPSLEAALRTLARDTTARAASSGLDLTVDVRTEGHERPLPDAVVDALHRGAHASVANVVQHSGADRCVLTLTWWDDGVSVDVADDGAGFDPAEPVGRESFGLAGLRSRMAALGGTVSIDTRPGEGTTIVLEVPTGHPSAPAPDQEES